LINNPRIIFLDEPTLGLDPKGQQDIQEILLDLNKSKNVTIFLSSHAISEVSSLCNTIAIVNRGKLIANGTIEELRNLAGDSNDLVHITVFNSQNTSYALSKLPVDNIIRYKGNDTDRRFKTVVVDPKRGDSSLNEIIKSFDKIGLQIYEIRRVNIGLEEIFFKLTEKSRSNANYNISQQDNFRGRRQLSYLPDQHDAATDQFGIEPQ